MILRHDIVKARNMCLYNAERYAEPDLDYVASVLIRCAAVMKHMDMFLTEAAPDIEMLDPGNSEFTLELSTDAIFYLTEMVVDWHEG